MTVGELKKLNLPDDMKIFLSSDEEGNNYGSTTVNGGVEICVEDNVLILYPTGQYEFDEIAPIKYNKEEE